MNIDLLINTVIWAVAIGWIVLMLNHMRKVIKKNNRGQMNNNE